MWVNAGEDDAELDGMDCPRAFESFSEYIVQTKSNEYASFGADLFNPAALKRRSGGATAQEPVRTRALVRDCA